jgi:hypothetical protein
MSAQPCPLTDELASQLLGPSLQQISRQLSVSIHRIS